MIVIVVDDWHTHNCDLFVFSVHFENITIAVCNTAYTQSLVINEPVGQFFFSDECKNQRIY